MKTRRPFTGVLDCDRKRIYEGDILQELWEHTLDDGFVSKHVEIFQVVWYRGGYTVKQHHAMIGGTLQKKPWLYKTSSLHSIVHNVLHHKVRKIGNMYDNPEMLAFDHKIYERKRHKLATTIYH